MKPKAGQNVALLISRADRPGCTLFSSCEHGSPVPGTALLGGDREEQRDLAPARPRSLAFPPPAGDGCRDQMPQEPGCATPGPESEPSPPSRGEKRPRGSGARARAQGRAAPMTTPGDALSARRALFV